MALTPLISVVIPTYNRAHLLPYAVKSVLLQTHSNFEIIVSDDGSTDATSDFVEQMKKDCREVNKNFVYLKNAHKGISQNLNAGILASKGDYIALLGDDDRYEPHALSEAIKYFQDEKIAIVYSDFSSTHDWIHFQKERVKEFDYGELQKVNYIGYLVIIRKAVLSAQGMYDTSLSTHEDWDLWLRLCRQHRAQRVPLPLYLCYQHPGRISHTSAMQESFDIVRARIDSGYYLIRQTCSLLKVWSLIARSIIRSFFLLPLLAVGLIHKTFTRSDQDTGFFFPKLFSNSLQDDRTVICMLDFSSRSELRPTLIRLLETTQIFNRLQMLVFSKFTAEPFLFAAKNAIKKLLRKLKR